MKKLVVDITKCNACGACSVAGDLLQENSDGTVEVIAPGIIGPDLLPKIEDIVVYCPTQALKIQDAGTNINISRLRTDMQQPIEVEKPDIDDYAFRLEDKEAYLKELPCFYSPQEDCYEYKSSGSARSAAKAAFRDEIYSQAEVLIEKLLVTYAQRRVNTVARYVEFDGNIKYEAHKKLIKRLRSYVNQIEILSGKKLCLPENFYDFETKDTEIIEMLQEKPNSCAIDRIKDALESASYFYDYIKIDSMESYVKVKKFFGGTDYEMEMRYAFNLTKAIDAFKRDVARKTWRNGRYTKQDATNEISRFECDLQKEWDNKIKLIEEKWKKVG